MYTLYIMNNANEWKAYGIYRKRFEAEESGDLLYLMRQCKGWRVERVEGWALYFFWSAWTKETFRNSSKCTNRDKKLYIFLYTMTKRNFTKSLDKLLLIWYNDYAEKHKKTNKKEVHYNENQILLQHLLPRWTGKAYQFSRSGRKVDWLLRFFYYWRRWVCREWGTYLFRGRLQHHKDQRGG